LEAFYDIFVASAGTIGDFDTGLDAVNLRCPTVALDRGEGLLAVTGDVAEHPCVDDDATHRLSRGSLRTST
jgi:hypothetical protein